MAIIILLGFITLLILFLLVIVRGAYRSLAKFRRFYKNAFIRVDVTTRYRYDLILNLTEVVKESLKRREHENLDLVLQARHSAIEAHYQLMQRLGEAQPAKEMAAAEDTLFKSIERLLTLPNVASKLKTEPQLQQLIEELTATEQKIEFACQYFNETVTLYNLMREAFPSNIVAGLFSFDMAPLIENKIVSIGAPTWHHMQSLGDPVNPAASNTTFQGKRPISEISVLQNFQ